MHDIHTGVDFDGDGTPDIVARMNDGRLRLYPGNSKGGFRSSRYIGHGWLKFEKIWLLRNGPNGHPVIYALDNDRVLTLYETDGRGRLFAPRSHRVADGLLSSAIPTDDWNNSGRSDFIPRDAEGYLYILQQDSNGRFVILS